MDERVSIRDSAKSLKKYGSTSNNSSFKKPETYIKHMISSTDTLQGIALKYGVTTEQIRRTNRLWANDSLFLRESLLIPVPLLEPASDSLMTSPSEVSLFDISECSQFLNDTSARSSTTASRSNSFRSDSGTEGMCLSFSSDLNTHSLPRNGTTRSISNGDISRTARNGARWASNMEYDPDNYNEFLVRIDCDIASTKTQVINAKDKSQFLPQDDDCIFLAKRKPLSRRKQQEQQQQGQSSHNGSLTELPSVVTQGPRVRNSLQKLQEQHDELFEL